MLEVETLKQPQQQALWGGLFKRLQQLQQLDLDMKQTLTAILSIAIIIICFSAVLQLPVSAQNGEARHSKPQLGPQ